MKKKTHLGVVIGILLLLIQLGALILALLLHDAWPMVCVAATGLVGVAVLFGKVAQGGKTRLICAILALACMVLSVLVRPEREVSILGNIQNNAMCFNTMVLKHQSPEEMAAGVSYVPYQAGRWKAPKGYSNEVIQLENCQAFLLKKDHGSHDRVIYQIHGGAYILGYNDQYNNNALLLSRCWDDADVFSIDYRSAAVAPFPAPLEDAVEGYQWLLKQGYEASQIVVSGDSAGGGLSLGMTLWLRDHGMDLPKCLVLASPWADVSQEGESYSYNRKKDAFFGCLSEDAVGKKALPVTYADGDSVYNPYISPVYADYAGMPPMLIQVGSPEMLLSDSLTVAERARAAGVPVELREYKGLWHVFYIGTSLFREQREAWDCIRTYLHASIKE